MRSGGTPGRLAIVFVAAFALRLAYISITPGLGKTLPKDYREYIVAAQRLLDRGTLVSPFIIEDVTDTPSCLMPPGYAAFVAGVYWLFGAETFAATLVLHLIQAAATSLAAVLVFLTARSLGGPFAGRVAALLAIVNPAVVRYTGYIWDTSLFTLGVALGVWVAYRLSLRPAPWRTWAGYGLLLGGLALLNPSLTIGYPFLVLWPLTKSNGWRWGAILRGVAATVCGWAIAIAPWTIRNYAHFGELIYVRCGLGMQLWLGVCPEASDGRSRVFHAQFPLMGPEQQHRIVEMGEGAYLNDRMRRSFQAIAADPPRFARLVAIRTVDYWAGTLFSHRDPGKGGWATSRLRAVGALFVMFEAVVIAGGLVFFRRIAVEPRWLLAVVISFSLVYCVTHVEVRYRTPCEPVVAVLAGMLISGVWRSLSRR